MQTDVQALVQDLPGILPAKRNNPTCLQVPQLLPKAIAV
jgi:hypothetical protein